jgi:hypothetical protein
MLARWAFWRGHSATLRGALPKVSVSRALIQGAILCAAVFPVCSFAQTDDPNGIHGRIELQDAASFDRPQSLDAELGTADHNDGLANLRLIYDSTWGAWSFDFHYLVTAEDGEDARLMQTESQLEQIPPATWFNLTDTFISRGSVLAEQGIDRLSLAYSTPDFVIRIGRQALTWGSGLVFRPMDLFDPFSPVALDTEFKPGTDMLYAQYLFADGSDLQFIAVPRSTVLDGAPDMNDSSFALHYHGEFAGFETTGLIARDHGDWTGALGVNGPLYGAAWNVEVLPTSVRDGPTVVSALANISDAQTLFDRNARLFAEYFHNGFGVEGDITAATLPSYLENRLARGQLFNIRQDYLAAGVSLEWSPLVTLSPTVIADLNDGSFDLYFSGSWSLDTNIVLYAGVQVPFGPRGSEYGGVPLAPADPVTSPSPCLIYLQLRRYF